jgi:hypothetical protein
MMHGFPPPDEAQVTLANWRLPPFNRWAFRHVREIVPSAVIARGGRRLRLARAIEPLERLAFETPDGGETTVAGLMADTCTHGLVVLRHGRIVLRATRGATTAMFLTSSSR